MKYTSETKVKFYASIGFVGDYREEVFTLDELGWDDDFLKDVTQDEFDKAMQEAHDDWMSNFADFSWYIEED